MRARSTIAAVSSPPGRGERAVIRLSGPRAREITESTCAQDGGRLALAGRGAARAHLFDGAGEQPVAVFWMPGPGSFTGEDVVEWHLPGSPPLVHAALQRALALGAELAAPGEFTRRAFENARLDLSRAEGVLALVHARHESERRAATALLLGGLSSRVERLREELESVRALCEASLDFDERETGGVARDELAQRVAAAAASLELALAWETAREVPAGHLRAALVGRPNAGKSSLYNRLARAQALVSDQAGTTRDALRRPWLAGALELELWDLAGTEAGGAGAGAEPDLLARERAREVRAAADLWLWVVDVSEPPFDPAAELVQLEGQDPAPPVVLVLHKVDAAAPSQRALWEGLAGSALPASVRAVVRASSRTGSGLDRLAEETQRVLGADPSATGEIRELSARHRAALAASRSWLAEAGALLDGGAALDLAAHALRRATDELDQVQGRTTPEDLLDRIFERFCLGK